MRRVSPRKCRTIPPAFVGLAARPRAAIFVSHRLRLQQAGGTKTGGSRVPVRESLCDTPHDPVGARPAQPQPGGWASWLAARGRAATPHGRAPFGFPQRSIGTRHDSPRWGSGLSNASDTRLGALPSDKSGGKNTESLPCNSNPSSHPTAAAATGRDTSRGDAAAKERGHREPVLTRLGIIGIRHVLTAHSGAASGTAPAARPGSPASRVLTDLHT